MPDALTPGRLTIVDGTVAALTIVDGTVAALTIVDGTVAALTIVGGTVAALTAALAAARRGRAVSLLFDPARIGGSFAGIQAAGRRLDLGSRLLELEYEDAPPRPISAFDPAHGSHRPVIAPVAAFIRGILGDGLRPAAEPRMWLAGRLTRCPLMTVDLSGLPAALPHADRIRIRAEPRATPPGSPGLTLEHASLAQHGPTLHARLIAPLCAKQHAAWTTVPAAERRKLWAALFHPATISEAFENRPITFRPHRPFATTGSHQLHPFVQRLWRAVLAEPGIAAIPAGPLVALHQAAPGTVTLRFPTVSMQLPAETCILGTAPDQAFPAAGLDWQPERLRAAVVWIEAATDDVCEAPSSLLIPDPAIPVLRISHAGTADGRTTLAIEFGATPLCPDAATAALHGTGLVRAGAALHPIHRLSGPAQLVPSPANRAAFLEAAARVTALGVHLLGGLRRFGFDSLNDQVADGLHFGECRC